MSMYGTVSSMASQMLHVPVLILPALLSQLPLDSPRGGGLDLKQAVTNLLFLLQLNYQLPSLFTVLVTSTAVKSTDSIESGLHGMTCIVLTTHPTPNTDIIGINYVAGIHSMTFVPGVTEVNYSADVHAMAIVPDPSDVTVAHGVPVVPNTSAQPKFIQPMFMGWGISQQLLSDK